MILKIDTPKRRGKVLRWLSEHGESGGYEMWKGVPMRLYFLYPLLTKLETEGLVERRWTEPKRVMYSLTPRGQQAVLNTPFT